MVLKMKTHKKAGKNLITDLKGVERYFALCPVLVVSLK
jgi:hypothetical protein